MLQVLLIALAAMSPGDDAREAVAKLVSPRSADREAAERAIEAMGDAASPALEEAADSRDLELRQRAAALMDAIEGRRLARPTLVTLDYRKVPLSEVVRAIGRSAGVSIVLDPGLDPRLPAKLITLESESAVPLWSALDRLSREGGVRIQPPGAGIRTRPMVGPNGAPNRSGRASGNGALVLRADGDEPAAPASDSGAMRVTVGSIVLNRSRSFVRTPESVGQPETSSVFTISLQVRAEPRLSIASLDEPRLVEARDERGLSLLGEPAPIAAGAPRAARGMENFGRGQALVFALRLPDDPGRSIARLRGTLRAMVVGRRGDPLAIPLGDSVGKTFASGSASILVHAVSTTPDGRGTTFEFTLDTTGGGAGSQPIYNPLDARSGLRPPSSARGQMEFLDAKGRVCHSVDLATLGMGFGSGGRTTVMFPAAEGTGPPVEARYFAATWATVEVPFDFRDIPMP